MSVKTRILVGTVDPKIRFILMVCIDFLHLSLRSFDRYGLFEDDCPGLSGVVGYWLEAFWLLYV